MAEEPNHICIGITTDPEIAIVAEIPTYNLIEEPHYHYYEEQGAILNHLLVDPTSYLCATCRFMGNRYTELGQPSFQTGDCRLALPGYLSWVDPGGNVNFDVHPRVIKRNLKTVTVLPNIHMELNRGGITRYGGRIEYAGFGGSLFDNETILVPLFCNYCQDRVGFQWIMDPYGEENTFGLPMLDMSTVYRLQGI